MIEHAVEKLSVQPVVHDGDYINPSTDADGATGAVVVLVGTPASGHVPTFDGTKFTPQAGGVGSLAPSSVAVGDTYSVPANRQVLFAMTIDNEGILDIEGFLIMVD